MEILRILWNIKFTNALNSKRETYMSIGFETYGGAAEELRRLLRDKKKHNIPIETLVGMDSRYLTTPMVGIDWEIAPCRCRVTV